MQIGRGLTAALLVAPLAGGCAGGAAAPAPPPAVTAHPAGSACARGQAFVIVRHAEKASTDKDTPLSERGRARAKDVASMLGSAGVTRLVATQFRRTQETLAPLAVRTGLPVEVRSADRASELVAELRGAPDGSIVVVATHSNLVPMLVRELGGGAKLRGVSGENLAEDDFSRVVVITRPCGASAPYVVELSSGDPTP
jgi:phosphohistidine phosphatase SixA